jgi:hypothetical protein
MKTKSIVLSVLLLGAALPTQAATRAATHTENYNQLKADSLSYQKQANAAPKGSSQQYLLQVQAWQNALWWLLLVHVGGG